MYKDKAWGTKLQQFTNSALEAVKSYFQQKELVEHKPEILINEATELWQEVNLIQSGEGSLNQTYRDFLWSYAINLDPKLNDAEVLELLVPLWSAARGNKFAANKPIDKFYTELELSWLWFLMVSCAGENEFDQIRVAKMRAIIRRYSNLPQIWLYLCQLDGDAIKTAYTF